jgi:hypothetical protein
LASENILPDDWRDGQEQLAKLTDDLKNRVLSADRWD